MTFSPLVDTHIFDCDGVLLNSNSLKVNAVGTALEAVNCEPELIEWAKKEFKENFGRTRRAHFDSFFTFGQLNQCNISRQQIDMAMQHYSRAVKSLYSDCDVIRETSDYIDRLPGSCQVFVVSASDQSELRGVLPKKFSSLEPKHIFGGPQSKQQNLTLLLEHFGLEEAIYYGDSVHDARAAINCGLYFVGLRKYSADEISLVSYCDAHNLNCYVDCSEVEVR